MSFIVVIQVCPYDLVLWKQYEVCDYQLVSYSQTYAKRNVLPNILTSWTKTAITVDSEPPGNQSLANKAYGSDEL